MARPLDWFNESRWGGVELIMRNIGITATATAAAVAVIGLAGCGSTVAGVAVAADPGTVSTATAVPSSLTRPVPIEELVDTAATDSAAFWRDNGLPIEYEIYRDFDLSCAGVAGRGRAVWCPRLDGGPTKLKYDPIRMQRQRELGGDLAVEIIIAHEMGHGAQEADGLIKAYPSENSQELSADCAAGTYVSSRYPGVSTDERGRALAATALGEFPERIAAFNDGFTGAVAPMACLTDYLK